MSVTKRAALDRAQAYSTEAKGLALLVIQNGQVIHEGYAAGVTRTTLTASASMMKSVVGLVTGIAVNKRMITSIDDPVRLYINEWQDDPRGLITVRHLLTMSSGLAPSDFARLLMSSDVNAVALETPRAEAPGQTFAYNNANSQILGLIIDRQARKHGYRSFADLLQRALWCPLGNGPAQLWIDREGGSPRFYGGLHASIQDWARIGELIRNHGRANGQQIVPRKWIADMSAPSATNPAYGYQMWLGGAWAAQRRYSATNPITVPHRAPYKAKDVVFFDGFGGQRVYVIPSKHITIARTGFTNLQYDDSIIVNLVLDSLKN